MYVCFFTCFFSSWNNKDWQILFLQYTEFSFFGDLSLNITLLVYWEYTSKCTFLNLYAKISIKWETLKYYILLYKYFYKQKSEPICWEISYHANQT